MHRDHESADAFDGLPPTEEWLFAQAIKGNPIPRIVSPEAKARAAREKLEQLAQFSPRHADELRRQKAVEAEARHDREILEWAASISTRAEEKLRAIQRREVKEREAWRRAEQYAEILREDVSEVRRAQPNSEWPTALGPADALEWDPNQPRHPKGTSRGGQWAPQGGSASAAGGAQQNSQQGAIDPVANSADASAAKPPTTKIHLPADHRGTWIKGTKGHGTFRYNDSPLNQKAGLAGKEVRFEHGHIAIGGFPPEAYYGGSAASATVKINSVRGTRADNLAADAAMRKKLGNPNWQRSERFHWNHAGRRGSNTMELIDERFHRGTAHKGPAANPRAVARGNIGRAMGVLTVYLAARDALQAGGILQPDYEAGKRQTYHFRTDDGSVFVVHPGGWFSTPKREFVDGPRKGQTEKITGEEVDQYRQQAEAEFGKYIPRSPLKEPRFIPGRQRKSLPLIMDLDGVPHEAGFIDDKGVHYHLILKQIPL